MSAQEQATSHRRSFRTVLDVAATVVMLVAASLVIWRTFVAVPQPAAAARGPEIPVPVEPISLDGAPVLGSASAKVAIVEFSDFECPYCGKFSKEILPEIKARFVDTGLVKLAFRHLPLTRLHSRAMAAAEAATCAADQGKFWALHDAFFVDPKKLQDADIAAAAASIGIDAAEFKRCQAGEATARVEEDVKLATALQLTGTPAFLLGSLQLDARVKVSEVITGARPVADFEAAIQRVAGVR